VTEPKPHQKSSKTSTVSNGSETSGELTADTETNSMENSFGSDSNYTNFENGINDMIVDSESQPNHTSVDNCVSNTDPDGNPIQSGVNNKRVKLDLNSDTNLESSTDTNDMSMESGSCVHSLQCSADPSRAGTGEQKATKQVYNSCDNNCSLSPKEQNSSLASIMSNPGLSLLLGQNNTATILSPETIATVPVGLNPGQAVNNCDIMICGNCRTLFTSLPLFIQHKRLSKCRLRFVCRCQTK
jgi:hypothetical protein